jgi:iron(III) transport system permease protein
LVWLLVAVLVAIPVTVVLLQVTTALFSPDTEVWRHLADFVLPRVVGNTLWLVFGVTLSAAVLGTGLAWLTAVCDFPGRRVFSWALLLPLAIPGYVLAFVMVGTFEYAGPVQTVIRALAGPGVELPPIRSRGGVIGVLTLALYPYVYLIARNAFQTQGMRALEVGRSLGLSVGRGFFLIALPMARPWIAGGALLVAMETLADFGTVSVFNYDTLTTAIYKAWFGLFSLESALQIASVLVLLVFVVVVLEQRLRARADYSAIEAQGSQRGRLLLRGSKAVAATTFASVVLFLGFVLPFGRLVVWSVANIGDIDGRFLGYVWQTLLLASAGAVLATTVALVLGYAVRNGARPARLLARWATMGYALPGTVLAVGVFVPLVAINNTLQGLLDYVFGDGAPQILLQSTLAAVLLAYLIRFLAVAYSPIDNNLLRITRSLDESSRLLGVCGVRMLRQVHLPILRGGVVTALTLTFVDIMKEMPITLMTRPFGWETLAVRVFEMTSEGEWARAALPSVAIVLVGLIPVVTLTQSVRGAH